MKREAKRVWRHVNLRLTPEEYALIERARQRQAAERPGSRVTAADVMRGALLAMDAKAAKR